MSIRKYESISEHSDWPIDLYFTTLKRFKPSKQFLTMDVSSSSSSSSAAATASSLAGSNASYINYNRMALPRINNEYVAFRVCKQAEAWSNAYGGGAQWFEVQCHKSTANELQIAELKFSINDLITNANFPAVTAAYNLYNEFRIRSMKIQLLPLTQHTVGMNDGHNPQQPVDVLTDQNFAPHYHKFPVYSYIWYPRQHYGLVPSDEFSNWTEFMESGENFTKAKHDMDNAITVSWVPQVIQSVNEVPSGVQPGDMQMPWMETSQLAIQTVELRGPYIVFKKPLALQTNYGNSVTPLAARYQAIIHYVVEFRDSK